MSERFETWGRTLRGPRSGVGFEADRDPFARPSDRPILAYGNGRSYGDSCLNDTGLLVDMRDAARILNFDAHTGIVEAQAGVRLDAITRLCAPQGWFLPVTPGTQFVTLGGAIANDVHGKNHHRRGTFGRWVRSLRLLRSDAAPQDLDAQSPLFQATLGGLGLTGIIEQASVQLLRVPSTTIRQTTIRFENLDAFFELCEAAEARHEYVVAWIDSLAGGTVLGRGHLICGDHAQEGSRSGVARAPLASIPFTPPVSPLGGLALRAFNELYLRRARPGPQTADVPFDSFFYPLDRIGGWNRLYGPRGLHQHQSVVPLGEAPSTVRRLIECARAHGQGSFLTVLKRFGSVESPALVSFPREGYTLTLDFPHRGERTLALLEELDAITVAAGGAVNPYKDARMSARTFAASFPQWRALEAMRDPAIVSDFWRRTALTLAGQMEQRPDRSTAAPDAAASITLPSPCEGSPSRVARRTVAR